MELYHMDTDNIHLQRPDDGHDDTLFPMCKGWMTPTRMCFFHQILSVEPRETPLSIFRGQMLSSFIASTRQLQANGSGFDS